MHTVVACLACRSHVGAHSELPAPPHSLHRLLSRWRGLWTEARAPPHSGNCASVSEMADSETRAPRHAIFVSLRCGQELRERDFAAHKAAKTPLTVGPNPRSLRAGASVGRGFGLEMYPCTCFVVFLQWFPGRGLFWEHTQGSRELEVGGSRRACPRTCAAGACGCGLGILR